MLIVIFMSVFVLITAVAARAATFQVVVEGGVMARVGETATMTVYIIPGEGEEVVGGQCTLTVDPTYVEFPADRNLYAADQALSQVDKFNVRPEQGVVSFKAAAESTLSGKTVFLKAPFKLKQAGATFVSLTSSTTYGGGEHAPSNPGYFRLVGFEGEVDPLLYATVTGDNVLLTTESLGGRYEVVAGGAAAGTSEMAAADLGFSSLEKTDDEAKADVVVGFSKTFARIGVRKWVRLDIVIEKFPADEFMTGIDVKVKYDPRYLELTDRRGQPANEVEVQENLDDLPEASLKQKAESLGVAVPGNATSEELLALLQSALKWDYRSAFTNVFINKVDKSAGEIQLTLLAGMSTQVGDIKVPAKVVTLMFRAINEGENIPITMEKVLVPVREGTQYVRNALVTIDSEQKACDETLPPSLCSGNFKLTGGLSFSINRTREPREVTIRKNATDTSLTTAVSKLRLTESWNVFLDGSLKNGLSVDGTISDSPGQVQQHIDLILTGRKSSVHFGDFNTKFESGSMISLNGKNINGMQFDYNSGNFEFGSVFAESKSSTKTAQISGNNTKGPYDLPGSLVIPGTVHIFDENGNAIPSSEYNVDYGLRTITFDASIESGKIYMVSYEESTFVFSTGNLEAFRLGYTKKTKGTGEDKVKLGVSYLVASAPKSSTSVIVDEEEAITLPVTYGSCPHKSTGFCNEILLKYPYVVPGSIVVVQNSKNKEYYPDTEDSTSFTSPVFIDHRGWLLGRLYVERPDLYGDLTVKYSHYNSDLVTDTGFLVYEIPFTLTDTSQIPSTGKTPWPTNMLSGSEIVLMSDEDTNQFVNNNDTMLCHDWIPRSGIASSIIGMGDDSEFCPGGYQSEANGITYQIVDQGTETYLEFRPQQIVPSEKYKYIKVKYTTVPTEAPSGSEYTKTAMGLTGKIAFTKDFVVDGEYATTNSDLASSYNVTEQDVTVDVSTGKRSDAADINDTGITCSYIGQPSAEETERVLKCYLPHGNITGNVTVTLQHCKRVASDTWPGGDPANDCVGYMEGTHDFSGVEYLSTKYEMDEYSHFSVNRDTGEVRFRRVRLAEGVDQGYTDTGNYFPNRGDKLIVNYIYDRILGHIVDGGSYNVNATYTGKKISASLNKKASDPFFDTSLGGSGSARSNNNNLSGSLRFNLGPWSMSYAMNNSDNKTLNPDTLEASSITSSTIKTYQAAYTGKAPLTRLSLLYGNTGSSSQTGMGTSSPSTVVAQENRVSLDMGTSFMKNKFTLDGQYNTSAKDYASGGNGNTDSTARNLAFKYIPRSNLDIGVGYTDQKTSPGDGVGRTNTYNLRYVPFGLVDTNVSVNKTVASTASKVTSISETTQYGFALKKSYYRFNDIKMNFTRTSSPQTGASSRTDTRNLTFKTDLPYGMTWTPGLTRTVSSTTTGWNRTDSRNWTLAYTQSNKKLKGANWQKNVSSTTTRSASSLSGTSNSTSSDVFTFNFMPSRQTALALTYNQVPLSSTHSYTSTYSYNYSQSVLFNLNLRLSHQGGTTLVRTQNITFNTKFKLNPTTDLSMDYIRNAIRYSGKTAPKTDTTFSATMNTRFQ
jgi:hypothetical protein